MESCIIGSGKSSNCIPSVIADTGPTQSEYLLSTSMFGLSSTPRIQTQYTLATSRSQIVYPSVWLRVTRSASSLFSVVETQTSVCGKAPLLSLLHLQTRLRKPGVTVKSRGGITRGARPAPVNIPTARLRDHISSQIEDVAFPTYITSTNCTVA